MAKKSRKQKHSNKKLSPMQQLEDRARLYKRLSGLLIGDHEDWTDETKRAAVANEVLKIREPTNAALMPSSTPLKKAFKKLNLKQENPHHWRFLLDALVDIHFNIRPGRGRKTTIWTNERERTFAKHVLVSTEAAARLGAPRIKNNDLARWIKHAFSDYYNGVSPLELAKRIPGIIRSRDQIKPT
jgi:hypothetical protein